MAEVDRTTWLLVKIEHHSNEDEEQKLALELKRRVELEMMDEAQVFLADFVGQEHSDDEHPLLSFYAQLVTGEEPS